MLHKSLLFVQVHLASYFEYSILAIQILKLQSVAALFQITDDEITSTFELLEAEHGRKLIAFYQLRSLFAPLVEGLVLLDRLVFLLEQVSSRNGSYSFSFELVEINLLDACSQFELTQIWGYLYLSGTNCLDVIIAIAS